MSEIWFNTFFAVFKNSIFNTFSRGCDLWWEDSSLLEFYYKPIIKYIYNPIWNFSRALCNREQWQSDVMSYSMISSILLKVYFNIEGENNLFRNTLDLKCLSSNFLLWTPPPEARHRLHYIIEFCKEKFKYINNNIKSYKI